MNSTVSIIIGIIALLLAGGAAVWIVWRRAIGGGSGGGGATKRRSGAKRSAVLLVGECGAGKTALLHRLVDGVAVKSVTSMKETEVTSWRVGDGGPVRRLVDLPGHGRLAYLQAQFLPIAGVVVLVVDSVAVLRAMRPVAERLYDVITASADADELASVVVACNKHEMLTAADASAVKRELLRELNELRTTRAMQPRTAGTDDDADAGDVMLGVDGEPLTYEQLPTSVEFVECSALSGEGIDALVDAIALAATTTPNSR
jgi:signal recognition particle receptor subunit beta